MNSTKAQKLYGVHKHPFSNGLNIFSQMTMSFEKNIVIVKQRFPLQQKERIKSLLQEFDNSIQLVCDLLREQSKHHENNHQRSRARKLTIEEENKLLKRAILNLHNKYIDSKKQLEVISSESCRLTKENQILKMQNHFLKQKEEQDVQCAINYDVY